MAKSKTKETEILVGDTKWKVRLLTRRTFNKYHGKEGKGAVAITDVTSHIVDFVINEFDDVTVRHEIFHCYFELLMSESTLDLTRDQVEENVASLMGKYGEPYIENTRKLYIWLLSDLP